MVQWLCAACALLSMSTTVLCTPFVYPQRILFSFLCPVYQTIYICLGCVFARRSPHRIDLINAQESDYDDNCCCYDDQHPPPPPSAQAEREQLV